MNAVVVITMIKKIFLAIYLLSPAFVFAAQPTIEFRTNLDKNKVFDIIDVLSQYLFGLLVAVTVFFVLYAAWLYLNSGGETEGTTAARSYLIYAAVAIAVGLFARALPAIVDSIIPR